MTMSDGHQHVADVNNLLDAMNRGNVEKTWMAKQIVTLGYLLTELHVGHDPEMVCRVCAALDVAGLSQFKPNYEVIPSA